MTYHSDEEELPFHFARNLYGYDELVNMQEISRMSGYSYWYIRALACGAQNVTRELPKPITRIGRRKLWLRQDVEAWISHSVRPEE